MPNNRTTPAEHRFWTERTFGIEMEMRKLRLPEGATNPEPLSGAQINRALSAVCQMPVHGEGRSYSSRHCGRAWEVKYDVSAGWEVTSPALMMDADGHNDELLRACDALLALRPIVDKTCGLHVHVDVSDFRWVDVQRLLALWSRYEPFFFEICPPSRRVNQYCNPIRAASWHQVARGNLDPNWQSAERALRARTEADFAEAARPRGIGTVGRAASGLSKYSSLNLNHWWLNGRVEFRLHSGTVSYRKIRSWVVLLLTLVGRVRAERAPRIALSVEQPRPSFRTEYILQQIGLGPSRWNAETQVYREIATWVEERRVRFGARPTSRTWRRERQRRLAAAGASEESDTPARPAGGEPGPALHSASQFRADQIDAGTITARSLSAAGFGGQSGRIVVDRERIARHTARPMTFDQMREIERRVEQRADGVEQSVMDRLYSRR